MWPLRIQNLGIKCCFGHKQSYTDVPATISSPENKHAGLGYTLEYILWCTLQSHVQSTQVSLDSTSALRIVSYCSFRMTKVSRGTTLKHVKTKRSSMVVYLIILSAASAKLLSICFQNALEWMSFYCTARKLYPVSWDRPWWEDSTRKGKNIHIYICIFFPFLVLSSHHGLSHETGYSFLAVQ